MIAIGNGTAGREMEQFVRETLREAGRELAGGDGQRGRGERLLGLGDRPRGVSRARPDGARRHLHRPPPAGSAGRTGQDRPQEHRRRPVPARRQPDRAEEGPRRGGRVLRQLRRRRSQHRLLGAALLRLRHRRVPGPGASSATATETAPSPTRQGLLEVPRFGAKAFEQAAGFLRIRGGENPSTTPPSTPRTTRWWRPWPPTSASPWPRLGADPALARADRARALRQRGRRPADPARHPRRAQKARPRPPRSTSRPSPSATTCGRSATCRRGWCCRAS